MSQRRLSKLIAQLINIILAYENGTTTFQAREMSTTPAPGSQGWQQPTDEAAMRTAVALAIVKARRGNNGEKEAAERATAALQRLKKGWLLWCEC